MSEKNILMIVASKDFRDEEYKYPRDIFEKNGFKVTVASTTKKPIPGMISMKIKADILVDSVNPDQFDAVVFVGGMGATEYWDHTNAHKIARKMNDQNKVVAAICLAPVTLGRSGVLKGKSGTVYESGKQDLIQSGVVFKNKSVVVEDNIVTANGPDSAKEFANKIVNLLLKNS